jgi:hypothetical protein
MNGFPGQLRDLKMSIMLGEQSDERMLRGVNVRAQPMLEGRERAGLHPPSYVEH